MDSEKKVGRYLGFAFLYVFVGSVTADLLGRSLRSGTPTEVLEHVSGSLGRARASILVELLVTAVGIVVLGSLLYRALNRQNKTMALVAFGLWLAEGVTLALSRVGAFALLPLSEEWVEVGSPASSHFQTMAEVMVDIDRSGYAIHMVFFVVGGFLWYWLFFRSKTVPQWLSLWGLGGLALVAALTAIELVADTELMWLGIPYMPFEPVIGGWLVARGLSWKEPPAGVPSRDDRDVLEPSAI